MKEIKKEKAIELRTLIKSYNVDDIKDGEEFYFLGSICSSEACAKNKPGSRELEIDYSLSPVNNKYYLSKFVKINDDEAKEVVTGETFKLHFVPKKINYHNPNSLMNYKFGESLYICDSGCFKTSNIIARLIYLLYSEKNDNKVATEIRTLLLSAEWKTNFDISHILNIMCSSKFELEFYKQNKESLTFYDEEPKVGEYFGYVGNISHIVPKADDKIGRKYFDTREIRTNYPLLFKRISLTEAVEVTSGVVFHFKSLLSTNVSFDNEYKNSPLCIDPINYIKFTDKYKDIYGKAISDFEKFSKWISKSLSDAKKTYDRKMDECENTYRSSLSDAYDIARVDNAVYDLEKKNPVEGTDIHKLIKEISSRTSDFD